jgi:dTDP-4-amino-4,6-dideoxygalactose transaminase
MAELAISGGKAVRRDPYPSWPRAGRQERAWLEKVLSGNRWFSGPRGDDPESLGILFGQRFAAMHGAGHGLPVSNGSVAIEVALRATGIQIGQEVIVPSYTFVSTATSVLMVGGVPVFADIHPDSYCLDPADAARRIGPNSAAVIPVHLGGHMADMAALNALAQNHPLIVVEDCAQAIDAGLGGRKAGAWGAMGTFSFQSNKTLTAGEGGLVMTDSAQLAEKIVAMRAFGRTREETAERSSAFRSQELSSNYRLSEFQAAVLLAQLERFPEQDERRQANGERLAQGLNEIPGLKHVRLDAAPMKHGYYYFLIQYEPDCFGGLTPERLCQALQAEGIPFVPGDRRPIYHHPIFEPRNLARWVCPQVLERYQEVNDLRDPGCPVAEEVCRRTLILRHQVLLAEARDMDDVVEAVNKVQRNIAELY